MTKKGKFLNIWKFVALGGTVVILVVIFLAYDLLRTPVSPCETIFEQTSVQLGLRLKHIDTEGGLILGRQKVQDLTEQAQVTALNLKTCCIVLDSGDVDPRQFLECKNTATGYERKLDMVGTQLAEANKARQEGKTDIVKEKLKGIEKILDEAAEISRTLQQKVGYLPRKPMKLDEKGIYFRDDFITTQMRSDWQLREVDRLRWKLQPEYSSLLIITQKGSIRGNDASLKNQFILNRTIPAGKFEVIVKASIQIQGQQNSLSLALWQDNDNYLEIGFMGFPHGYNTRRSPHFTKELQGQRNAIEGERKGHGGVNSPEVVYLKIGRFGNKYNGYYAYGEQDNIDIDDLKWIKIGTHAWIDFQGRPAIWADNGSGTHYGSGASPEVPAEFDYILIRKPGDQG